jgi:hypothetical protein
MQKNIKFSIIRNAGILLNETKHEYGEDCVIAGTRLKMTVSNSIKKYAS